MKIQKLMMDEVYVKSVITPASMHEVWNSKEQKST